MRIGTTCFGADGGKSGIGVYLRSLLAAMGPELGEDSMVVYGSKTDVDHFVPQGFPGFQGSLSGRGFGHPVLNVGWHQTVLPIAAAADKLDCLFLPAANRRTPVAVPCPAVGTVHDMSSIHIRGKYDPARVVYITKVLPWLFRRLDRIITVSASTRNDIVEYARVPAERIDIIHLGVDHSTFNTQVDPLPVERPFILYVSRLEHPGKNHVGAIRAFNLLKSSFRDMPHKLVFVGRDWFRADDIHAAAAASPYRDDIEFKGFVAASDLPRLYRAADCVVYPSLYEGFGLPLLEAMACGAPVACSNISSLPEVAGDGAALFDPEDPGHIAETVMKIIDDTAFRSRLSQRGIDRSLSFTWEKTARATLAVLKGSALSGCNPGTGIMASDIPARSGRSHA